MNNNVLEYNMCINGHTRRNTSGLQDGKSVSRVNDKREYERENVIIVNFSKVYLSAYINLSTFKSIAIIGSRL